MRFFFQRRWSRHQKKKRRERASNLCSRQLDHKQDSFCPNRPCLYLPVDARQPRPSRKQNKIVFVTIDLLRIDVVDVVGVAVQQVSNYTVLWMHHTQPQSAMLARPRHWAATSRPVSDFDVGPASHACLISVVEVIAAVPVKEGRVLCTILDHHSQVR